MAARRRIPWWAWVIGCVVVAVGTVAALGGFSDVPVQKLPTIELGETYSTNEVDVTVLGVELSDGTPFNHYTEDGKEYVNVEVEVTATTDAPTLIAGDLIRVLLEGVIDVDERPEPDELRNGTYPATLQPGLPMRIGYSWEVDAGSVKVGDPIVIGIFAEYDDPNSAIFDDAKTPPVPVVRIVTEVGS